MPSDVLSGKALQNWRAVTAYLSSKQLLLFGFAEQGRLPSQKDAVEYSLASCWQVFPRSREMTVWNIIELSLFSEAYWRSVVQISVWSSASSRTASYASSQTAPVKRIRLCWASVHDYMASPAETLLIFFQMLTCSFIKHLTKVWPASQTLAKPSPYVGWSSLLHLLTILTPLWQALTMPLPSILPWQSPVLGVDTWADGLSEGSRDHRDRPPQRYTHIASQFPN